MIEKGTFCGIYLYIIVIFRLNEGEKWKIET